METVNIPKYKLGQVIADVERLISDFEELVDGQDNIVRQRMNDITECKIEGRTEKELDKYLKKRGVKIG